MKSMSSSRPYIMEAIYQWVVDNNMTPHIVVDAQMPAVHVPEDYVQEGRIVLNMAPRAIQELVFGRNVVEFDARFKGEVFHISVPYQAVGAIYATENGRGIMFDESFDGDDAGELEEIDDGSGDQSGSKSKPHLTVIK